MNGSVLLSVLVMQKFHFSFSEFFGILPKIQFHSKDGQAVTDDLRTRRHEV